MSVATIVRDAPEVDVFKRFASLRDVGRPDEALAVLRDALRRGMLGPERVDKAGRLIRKGLAARGDGAGSPSVRLLGQCTTSWLATALTAVGFGRGASPVVEDGGFDQILQDLEALAASGDKRPDVVVLLPWASRLVDAANSGADMTGRVAAEMDFWKRAWDVASGRLGSRVVQVGYDWMVPGPLGYSSGGKSGGVLGLVRDLNRSIREALPPDAFYLDLEALSGEVGRASFYDPRRYYWTKQPFGESGTLRLAEHLWAGIRAVTTGPKKVLVLDLDNTLWGGVVGETGPLGVALGDSPDGEAFRSFQKHAKGLTTRGVLLAVASKNNPDDAREPFQVNPEMALKLDDIAAFEACWEPKGTTIARMAKTLNLGLDSFVFFDDNPAEREQVRQALPEVEVVDVPEDPAEYVRALQAGLWFETVGLTDADRIRVEQYAVERKRRELEQSATSIEDYLISLEMVADVRDVDDAEMQRVVQLLAKTNQFNLTTRRHTREDVLAMLAKPGSFARTYRVADKFGDHGLVAVLIAVPDEAEVGAVRVDTWLMSCRVIARTVEQFVFGDVLDRARALGHRTIVGEYIPTKKNALVEKLYDDLGFARRPDSGGGTVRYALEVDSAPAPVCYITKGGR